MKKSKRIKKVFRKCEECVKRFVEQTQDFGVYRFIGGGGWHNSSTKGETVDAVYFQGKRIYSYGDHYLLGRIDLKLSGVTFSVVNFTHYSRQTDGHAWDLRHALEKTKRIVIDLDLNELRRAGTVDFSDLTRNASDAELKSLAIKTIKENCFRLNERIFECQFTPWQLDKYFYREIRDHNKLVETFKLPKLAVKMPREISTISRIVTTLYHKARKDLYLRCQTNLSGQSAEKWSRRFSYYNNSDL